MAASFRIDGLNDFQAKIQAGMRQRIEPMKKELYQIGEEIMTDSKQNYCPWKTGYMRSTGHVETEDEPPEFRVVMAYGASYSIFVHENLIARHPHGQAKFLEIPYRERFGTIAERLAAAGKNS